MIGSVGRMKLIKKMLCFIALGITVFTLSSCDSNSSEDISISQYKLYINNTEHWDISTYNGYKCVAKDTVKNEDGNYTITFEFKAVE